MSYKEFFLQTSKNSKKGASQVSQTPLPTWDEYIKSGKYIPPERLSKKQYESVVAVIGTDPYKIFSPERVVSLGVLCVGKGGGKDYLIVLVLGYIITVLLHLDNPQKFLGVGGYLDLLNVAVKGKQAEKVFFSAFVESVKRNKWMLERYTIYEEGKLINKPMKPKGVIKLKNNEALFPKRIRCLSESSKNETWEGYNVIFFVLDEISGFVSETQRENGWKIFETANSSCISRRTTNFRGMGFIISYPRKEKDDIIIELYKMSRQYPHMHGVFAFSWHFKPSWTYSGKKFLFRSKRFNRFFSPKMDCPNCKTVMTYGREGYVCPHCMTAVKDDNPSMGIEIPEEYKEAFDTNPEGSLTKFCCLPPRTSGEYFEYPEKVWACIDPQQEPLFKTEYYTTSREVDGVVYSYRAIRIIACTEKDVDIRMKKYHYVAWLDNAEVACDAVVVIARKEIIPSLGEDGKWSQKEICRIMDVINWIPLEGLPIDLENVEIVLTKEIPRYINLREVGADRYESALLDQKLRSKRIRTHRFNLNNTHYDTAKYHIYRGIVRIFDEEPYMNKELRELTSLEQLLALMAGDTKPDKDSALKKDKADGVVGCINLLMGGDIFKTDKKRPTVQKLGKGGIPRTFSPYKSGAVRTFNPYLAPLPTSHDSQSLPVPRGVK